MELVRAEREGAVSVVRLNNPSQYNALAPGLLRELVDALRAAEMDPSVRAILLTGEGKGFCSGAQFGGDGFARGSAIGAALRETTNPAIARMRACRKPIVVAMNGAAAGAGVGIALAGDIVVAARSARFVLSFSRIGAALDAGTSVFLQRSIGQARARALSLLAEPLSAEQAADWGLIWKVVDDEALGKEAMAVARRLAGGPPISLALVKEQIERAWGEPLDRSLEFEAEAQTEAFLSEDLREGARAFVEKRPPEFKGR